MKIHGAIVLFSVDLALTLILITWLYLRHIQ